MKLYLSSYRIPTPDALRRLVGQTFDQISVAIITNAKDYYIERAKAVSVERVDSYLRSFGMQTRLVDLKNYSSTDELRDAFDGCKLLWVMGGNTYMLREAMRTSGFERIIKELLENGIVYAGESAGALVAGGSITGVEAADEPRFATTYIPEGLALVPFVFLPHVDNPEFASVLPLFRKAHVNDMVVELKDSQAVIFENGTHTIVESASIHQTNEL